MTRILLLIWLLWEVEQLCAAKLLETACVYMFVCMYVCVHVCKYVGVCSTMTCMWHSFRVICSKLVEIISLLHCRFVRHCVCVVVVW